MVTQRDQWDLISRVSRVKSQELRRKRIADILHSRLVARGFLLTEPWYCFEGNNGELLYIQEEEPGELRE